MKRLINVIVTLCGAVIACCSCTDELMEGSSATHPVGVDYSKMVEVTLPFGIAKEISTTIVTRAGETAGHESEIKGLQLAIYEANGGEAKDDKLILWKRYEKKTSENAEGDGFWESGSEGVNDGYLRFLTPTGKVYIYILGNATGTLMNYYPKTADPNTLSLMTRQDFIDNVQPKWTNSFTSDDGYLPMTAMVNNQTGICYIEENRTVGQGNIYYFKDGEDEKTYIERNPTTTTYDNTFVLRRLVAKINFTITAADDRTFTPSKYIFRNVGEYVPSNPRAGHDYGLEEDYLDKIPVVDSPEGYFSPTTPNSFTVYLPENRRNLPKGVDVANYNERDAIEKTMEGENQMEDDVHYKFKKSTEKLNVRGNIRAIRRSRESARQHHWNGKCDGRHPLHYPPG